jgi:hypothetical protein
MVSTSYDLSLQKETAPTLSLLPHCSVPSVLAVVDYTLVAGSLLPRGDPPMTPVLRGLSRVELPKRLIDGLHQSRKRLSS